MGVGTTNDLGAVGTPRHSVTAPVRPLGTCRNVNERLAAGVVILLENHVAGLELPALHVPEGEILVDLQPDGREVGLALDRQGGVGLAAEPSFENLHVPVPPAPQVLVTRALVASSGLVQYATISCAVSGSRLMRPASSSSGSRRAT
jgi:hypothetical protein